jgi:hydrogenase large subunit
MVVQTPNGFSLDNAGQRIVVDPGHPDRRPHALRGECRRGGRHPQRRLDRHHVARPRGHPARARSARRLGLHRTDLRRLHRHPRADIGARGRGCAGDQIPENANSIRNLMQLNLQVHDHIVHFYHLHALDWVNPVNALRADPRATSELQQTVGPNHPMSSPAISAMSRPACATSSKAASWACSRTATGTTPPISCRPRRT